MVSFPVKLNYRCAGEKKFVARTKNTHGMSDSPALETIAKGLTPRIPKSLPVCSRVSRICGCLKSLIGVGNHWVFQGILSQNQTCSIFRISVVGHIKLLENLLIYFSFFPKIAWQWHSHQREGPVEGRSPIMHNCFSGNCLGTVKTGNAPEPSVMHLSRG